MSNIKDKIMGCADTYKVAGVSTHTMYRATLISELDATDREVESLQREVQQQALARENVSKMRKTLMEENEKLRSQIAVIESWADSMGYDLDGLYPPLNAARTALGQDHD